MKSIPKVILFIESSRGYGRGLLRGISLYSDENGPWSFIFESEWNEDLLANMIGEADGIIGHIRRPSTAEVISELGIPAVVSAHAPSSGGGVYRLKADSRAIGKMAAEYFIGLGFKNYGFCGLEGAWYSEERGTTFSKTIAKNKFKTSSYNIQMDFLKKPGLREEVKKSLVEWLQSLAVPAGIFASNDDCARKVVEACKIAELHIPDEIAILGVDNDEFVCTLGQPPLSSIAINAERAGYEAAALLDKLMAGKSPKSAHITVRPTHVVARQSTDIMAVSDAEVRKALRFILENWKRPIGVPAVVDAAITSRRALERKFKKILGCSVSEQIRRIRTEQIAKMLIETDLSVSQIAAKLGFHRVDHICRYFRQQYNMSPQEYREKNLGK